jgi:hypothetical protein
MLTRNKVVLVLKTTPTPTEIALIALLSELPSKKNKPLQEATKASAQVELEGSFDMTTSCFKTEESTSSDCDWKRTRDAQTFFWFEEPENWDDICPPQEKANKRDMQKLKSSFVRLDQLKMFGTKTGEKRSKTTRQNILEEASRVQRLLNQYDSCWSEIGWARAQSFFESSKNVNDKKEPETMSSLTSSTPKVTMKSGSTKEKSRRTQDEVGKTNEIPLHMNTFFICGQKSRDIQQVLAKRNGKDMAANIAKTHMKGRYFAQCSASRLQ